MIFVMLQLIIVIIYSPISAIESDIDYEIETSTEVLPYPLSRGSAVWVEEQQSIYIFGGRNKTNILDLIMKYNPSEEKLEILDIKLPTVLMGSTAVYDNNHIYIFGGKDYDNFYDTILKFDPKTETITYMSARLPNPTVGAAAIWTGEYIYFFGGSWGGVIPQKFDTILRYDPKRDDITIMNSTLTYGRSGLATTWDGSYIYISGGSDGINYSSEVFRYSPNNDTLITLPGKLPTGRLHIQAEYHDGSIYIFGGRSSQTNVFKQILRYDLETGEVEVLSQKLPTPTEFRMHAYDGETIYLIGGFAGGVDINQFTKFTPNPSSTVGSGSICPPENPNESIGIIILILAIIIILILVNNYRKKKENN